jgi:hypothetical protein
VARLLIAAATEHVNADLAFLDLAEEDLLGDDAALADLATTVAAADSPQRTQSAG